MKGWRSILVAAAIAGGTAALHYLANYDWVAVVGPTFAIIITQVVAVVMRLITTTPVGTTEAKN